MHLDIVMPAHNEEGRIGRTLDRYRRAIPHADTRFVVALDGCSDGTAAVVHRRQRVDARICLLELPKLGKGGALAEALRSCDAPLVAFVDADGATPPPELLRLARLVDDGAADIAIASRRLPASVNPTPRSLSRRVTSAGFAHAVRRLFHLPHHDTQCGAKVLRHDALARIAPLLSSRDFLFDVDLLLAASDLDLPVAEVPTVWVDQAGSKVDALRDARRMAASALRLWFHHRVLPVEPTPATATSDLGALGAPSDGAGEIVIDLTGQLGQDRDRDEHLVGA